MTDLPIERLIEASSLGTPDARRLRESTSKETARRIVARSEQIAYKDGQMTYNPRLVLVKPARAIVGGVVHDAPSIVTPGVTVDPDGTVRDADGTALARIVTTSPDR